MMNVGCIVMYSKPIEENLTMPAGTVFYTDGSSEELSLKEAANYALSMALEYGFANAIENERYFNVTYEEFVNNIDRYKNIAMNVNVHEDDLNNDSLVNDTDSIISNENVRVVEPPRLVKNDISNKIKSVKIKDDMDGYDYSELEDIFNKTLEKIVPSESTQDDLNNLIERQNEVVSKR